MFSFTDVSPREKNLRARSPVGIQKPGALSTAVRALVESTPSREREGRRERWGIRGVFDENFGKRRHTACEGEASELVDGQ